MKQDKSENIMLSERSQTQRVIIYMILFMCHLGKVKLESQKLD